MTKILDTKEQKYWIRNPSIGSKGISLQYYDKDEHKIKKTYPDFIFQNQNN